MKQGGTDRRPAILAAFALAAALVVAVIVATRGGDDDGSRTAAGVEGCAEVEAPEPKRASFKKPGRVLRRGERATAVVETSCGSFEIALDTKRAPKTANSFAFLAERGFYDGLGFHRIVPGFVIQGGDPQGTGTGGPGYSVDEQPPPNLAYTKGLVAMAKSPAEPPGRSGSQFFVVTGDDAGLPPEYALVGRVSDGYETVARIEKMGGEGEAPLRPVVIERVTVERR